MSTVQVGFSPAAPGNSVISGVAAGVTAGASGDAEGALGFVDALLSALAPGLDLQVPIGLSYGLFNKIKQ